MSDEKRRAERFRVYLYVALGTWVLAAALGLLAIATWRPFWSSVAEQVLLSDVSIASFSVVMLACAYLLQRRGWTVIRLAGLVFSAIAMGMNLLGIWGNLPWLRSYDLARCAAAVAAWGGLMLLLELMQLARLEGSWVWLRRGTGVAATSLAVAMTALFVLEYSSVGMILLLVAAATLAGCGILCTLALHWLTSTRPRHTCVTTPLTVSLTCPRCQETQPIAAGRSTCRKCRLVFHFEIEEERCPKCGYLLYKLVSDRCPECGTPIFTPPPAALTPDHPAES